MEKFLNDFLLAFLIENKTVILTGLGFVAYSCLEYFFGKSDKVKEGSLIEFILAKVKRDK